MLKFGFDVRPVNFLALFFFCEQINRKLASDSSSINSGLLSYTFCGAQISCEVGMSWGGEIKWFCCRLEGVV